MIKTMLTGLLGIVLGGVLLLAVPHQGQAQYWDYDAYDGVYGGPYGSDWYYDYYDYPYTSRYRDPYPGTQGWRWKSDWELKEDVESELTWSPFVDADDIDVSVQDGKVTLKGTVENQSSVHDAIENAYEAGAKTVISRLQTREED